MKKPTLFVTTVLFDDGSYESIEVAYEGDPVEGYISIPVERFDNEAPREYIARTTLREVYGTE